ncbi:response regulator [Peptoclostridium litorale]|uniref:response regulator n=1 Tax=Peptoclostridium litorale TaxID=1557 RepID=UPI001356684A|nr:response regulator [Peptoclostridium litorale]
MFLDDQTEVLYLIEKMLKDESYDVLIAQNVESAFEILQNNDINVVVSDMIMPDMNGFDFLEKVKEDYPHVVRVILSGNAQTATILEALNSGQVYRYITKPWRVDAVGKKTIMDALGYSFYLRERRDMRSFYFDNSKILSMLEKLNQEYAVYCEDCMHTNVDWIKENDLSEYQLVKEGFEVYNISSKLSICIRDKTE